MFWIESDQNRSNRIKFALNRIKMAVGSGVPICLPIDLPVTSGMLRLISELDRYMGWWSAAGALELGRTYNFDPHNELSA